MQSESARMSSGAEARFRIDAPNASARRVKVIALDRMSETVVASLARHHWNNASFLTASAFAGAPPERGFSMPGWLADLTGRARDLIGEIDGADLVVMVAAAGEDAGAAALIGEACSLRRVGTTGLILSGPAVSDEKLSATLALLRPWSLMLVIAEGTDYVEDMLHALRA
jgi:hypothetical protein